MSDRPMRHGSGWDKVLRLLEGIVLLSVEIGATGSRSGRGGRDRLSGSGLRGLGVRGRSGWRRRDGSWGSDGGVVARG